MSSVRHLWYWQGLRWAPGGLALIATAVAAVVPLPGPVCWVVWALALTGAARLHGLAAEYYARRFPWLRPGRRTGGGLVASIALVAALAADARWTPPVLVTAIVGAVVLIAYGIGTGGGRPHHLVGIITLLLLAPLPALGVVDGGRPRVLLWLFAGGGLYLVLAVLDHRELAVKRRSQVAAARYAPYRRPVDDEPVDDYDDYDDLDDYYETDLIEEDVDDEEELEYSYSRSAYGRRTADGQTPYEFRGAGPTAYERGDRAPYRRGRQRA